MLFFQVKRIITPKVTTFIILGYLVLQGAAVVVPASLLAITHFSRWPANLSVGLKNQLQSRRYFAHNFRGYVELIASTLLNMILYGIIIIETILLIMFFKRNIKSRSSLISTKNEMNSAKENRLVKSVIGVCVFFIVTSCPRNIERLCGLWPDLLVTYSRHIRSLLITLFGLNQLLDGINHSFNVFVYMAVNSRFRSSLFRLSTSRRVQKNPNSK